MRTKSDNIEIINSIDTSEAINELFKSFIRIYQKRLYKKMRGSSFVPNSVDLLYYQLHKISLNRGSSYVNYPEWLKIKQQK